MSKPRVLLIGEHPLGTTGNAGMLHAFLSDLDFNKYEVSCAVAGIPSDIPSIIYKTLPIPIVSISNENDFWGSDTLLDVLGKTKIDVVVMIGIDIWRYIEIMPEIIRIRDDRGFKIAGIFPYDLSHIRAEMIDVLKSFDIPCVYSKYGYDMLLPHVPHIQYYRPMLRLKEIWKPGDADHIEKIRRNVFHGTTVPHDTFMVGFVGVNQYRKDPQKLIKGFSIFAKKHPDSILYLHTEKKSGVYNIPQYAIDCEIETGKLLMKPDYKKYPLSQMPDIFNCFDVYVNCSIQEGLSWTVIESMLCGTPAIISDTTAHKDLIVDPMLTVPCETETMIPIKTQMGHSWVDALCCDAEDIADALEKYYLLEDKTSIIQKTLDKGKEWLDGCNNPNELVESMLKKNVGVVKSVKNAVLFVQHSAAGDVFMTTRCLRGLKERHKGLPLHYMTQEKYHNILEGNPYIDEVLPWNQNLLMNRQYMYQYNPHGDVILPGHWGRNCNSILSDFYWKILRVVPDDFYILPQVPSTDKVVAAPVRESMDIDRFLQMFNETPVAIVHTTGGDHHFRTYKYMGEVSGGLRERGYFVIQLGSKDDYDADADVDFRGLLSFRETAWVVQMSDVAVTVDSFMSHLAGAFGISQVTLFGSGNYVVVQPWQKPGSKLICMSPDYVYDCKGLGPCSASIRDCPVPCTGRHNPMDILKAIDKIRNKE